MEPTSKITKVIKDWAFSYEQKLIDLIYKSEYKLEQDILEDLLVKKFDNFYQAQRLDNDIIKWGMEHKPNLIIRLAKTYKRDEWETFALWLIREYDKCNSNVNKDKDK